MRLMSVRLLDRQTGSKMQRGRKEKKKGGGVITKRKIVKTLQRTALWSLRLCKGEKCPYHPACFELNFAPCVALSSVTINFFFLLTHSNLVDLVWLMNHYQRRWKLRFYCSLGNSAFFFFFFKRVQCSTLYSFLPDKDVVYLKHVFRWLVKSL